MNGCERIVQMLVELWAHRVSHPPPDEGPQVHSDLWRMGYAAGLRDAMKDVGELKRYSTFDGPGLPLPDRVENHWWSIPVFWQMDLRVICSAHPDNPLPLPQTLNLRKDVDGDEWVWRVQESTLRSGRKRER